MKLLESVKNIIIVALFVSAVLLAALYIINTQNLAAEQLQNLSVNSLVMLREDSGAEMTEQDKRQLMPAFIGYNTGEGFRGVMTGVDIINDVYNSLATVLTKVFGSEASQTTVEISEWDEMYSTEQMIYIRYHTPIPYPVIYYYSTNDENPNPITPDGEMAYISEAFIKLEHYTDNLYKYNLLAKDSDGRILRFEYSDYEDLNDYFDISVINAYNNNKVFSECEFGINTSLLFDNFQLAESDVIFKKGLNSRYINVTSILSVLTENEASGILKLFGYNPDRLNKYSDGGGSATIYVERHGNLRISQDGNITFKSDTTNNGIALYDIIGYGYYIKNFNLLEIINSTRIFAGRLKESDRNLIGGEADIYLANIYSSEEGIIVEYGYSFDNLKLVDIDYNPIVAFRFVVNNGFFTQVDFKSLNIKVGTRLMNFSQRWILNNIDTMLNLSDSEDGDKIADIEAADNLSEILLYELESSVLPVGHTQLVYTIRNTLEDEIYPTEWIVKYIAQEAEDKDELE